MCAVSRTPRELYREIAHLCSAIKNCQESNNSLWEEEHSETLDHIEKNILPSGSGIDCGCKVDRDVSGDKKVVITFSFHHMDEHGFYCGWTDYKCVVTPSLLFGYVIRIVGRDKNYIKEYLEETFNYVLGSLVWSDEEGNTKSECHGDTQPQLVEQSS